MKTSNRRSISIEMTVEPPTGRLNRSSIAIFKISPIKSNIYPSVSNPPREMHSALLKFIPPKKPSLQSVLHNYRPLLAAIKIYMLFSISIDSHVIKRINRILILLLALLTSPINNCVAGDNHSNSIAEFIATMANMIGGNNKLGMLVAPVWEENPEVRNIHALPDKERVVAIVAVIEYIQDNVDKIFNLSQSKNKQQQAKALMFLYSYEYLRFLTKGSEHDHALNDFLVIDNHDLKLVLARKKTYEKYLAARSSRFDHLLINLMIDKDMVTNYFNYKSNNDNDPHAIANKTTIYSLIKTCSKMVDACANK